MSNPFRESFGTPDNNNLHNLYQAFSQASNPMQLFMSMAKNNPQLNNVINLINSGNNPKNLFYTMCQQRNINPEQFLKSITG